MEFDDIIKEVENLDTSQESPIFNSSSNSEEDSIHYDIVDSDDGLIAATKNLINNKNVKKSDLYNTFGRLKGYNMYYQLEPTNNKGKSVLSWKRLEEWCDFLGVTPQIIFIDNSKE